MVQDSSITSMGNPAAKPGVHFLLANPSFGLGLGLLPPEINSIRGPKSCNGFPKKGP